MSETDQDKTEEPSARRLEKSREEGQVARSKEINSALLLLIASLILQATAEQAAQVFSSIMEFSLSFDREVAFDSGFMFVMLKNAFLKVLPLVSFILLTLMLAGAAGQLVVGGWIFNIDQLAPKGSRMNPSQWFSRVFSVKGAMELLKSILKILLVISALFWLIYKEYPLLLTLSRYSIESAMVNGVKIMGQALFVYALCLVLIAAIDAPFQAWSHKEKLKMTRQELKDEHKDMEGSPEVKQKIRQLQRQMATQRMMERIPEADVVIVNPTHYSVALKYDQERSSAPFVIAKGVDQVALHIREIAKGNDVQIVESALLTRAIYYSTDIDQEIPADLYLAVAQVLAYVFQLSQFQQGKAPDKPVLPTVEVPEQYQKN